MTKINNFQESASRLSNRGRSSLLFQIKQLSYYILSQFRINFKKLSYKYLDGTEAVSQQKTLKWCFIYGPGRSGTSYMNKMVRSVSKLAVGDWGLGYMLNNFEKVVGIDKERFLKELSNNILDNAKLGQGNQLDLVYKQANVSWEEYEILVKMWGKPEKIIFCLREPSGYIASAQKKFRESSLELLQNDYVYNLQRYEKIGGDIFEYSEKLTLDDYINFLSPLQFNKMLLENFVYSGEYKQEDATEQMWSAYYHLKEKHQGKIYPSSSSE